MPHSPHYHDKMLELKGPQNLQIMDSEELS